MKNVIYFTYHRTNQIDFDWLKTAMASIKRHCVADIIVITDNIPRIERDIIISKFKCELIRIKGTEWENRRTLCRLELTNRVLNKLKNDETRLIQSDIDVLFLDNPFKAFDEQEFEIGVTVRMYDYHVPVNSGLVFFRVDDRVKRYAKWAVEQAKNPTWWPYMMSRSSRDNLDWGCDQDIICAIFHNSGWIYAKFEKLRVRDVGFKYNYCAGTDVLDFEPAAHLMRRALETRDYPVLHFKGQYLKKMIYEPCMEKYR